MNTFSGGIDSASEVGVFIGIGGNLSSERFGPPQQTLRAAVAVLPQYGVEPLRQSRWYRSSPVPASDQPWFVNAVVAVATSLEPAQLLSVLHKIENEFGRLRQQRWEARPLDLDLLDHGGRIEAGTVRLPHPRLHERAFVLLPLKEVAPTWVHPESGLPIDQLCARLDPNHVAHPLDVEEDTNT